MTTIIIDYKEKKIYADKRMTTTSTQEREGGIMNFLGLVSRKSSSFTEYQDSFSKISAIGNDTYVVGCGNADIFKQIVISLRDGNPCLTRAFK